MITQSALNVGILCGPASNEDQVYYAATQRDSLSTRDLHSVLQRLGARSVDTIDVTTCVDWKRRILAHNFVVINMHGSPGEDGTIQGLLESHEVPFLGSRVEASVVALNKNLTKLVAAQAGVPTPSLVFPRTGAPPGADMSGRRYLQKPRRGGSSLGISWTEKQEPTAHSAEWIIEEYVAGVDVTVTTVEGDTAPYALPAIALRHAGHIYDADSKLKPKSGLRACAERPPSMDDALSRCEELALVVHAAIGARHVSRSDFVVVGNQPLFLEINTLPGLSVRSIASECAYAAGLSYDDFIALVMGSAI